MTPSRALVSGAGIAGLALAHELLGAGWSVTLVERAPSLRAGGYKIDVRGVATHVLRRMGLYDAAQARALQMETSAIVNHRGKPIATLPADTLEGRAGDDLELVRGDLLQLLADSVSDRAEWRFGETITSLTETNTGIRVTFSSGPAQAFGAVFGADGLHSQVRALAFGEEAQFSRPLGAYVGVFAAPEIDFPEGTEWMYPLGPGRSLIVYRTAPSEPPMVMLLFRADLPPALVRRSEVEAQKQILYETFASGGWLTGSVLEALRRTPDLYFDAVSQIQLPRWSKGRVALLGDAAYAATLASGQGTSLALVGAYVLAQALGKAAQCGQAFELYERDLRAFVEGNQRLALGNLEGMVPKSRAALTLQTLMLRLMPYLPGKGYLVRRVTEPIQKAANALDLAAL